jgi:hypothetical protein
MFGGTDDWAGRSISTIELREGGLGREMGQYAIHVPEANGVAERFVRTVRSECLDWLLMVNARHAERAMTAFIDHDNRHRPQRSLELAPPNGRTSVETWTGGEPIVVRRRDRPGGRIHEYERAA